MDIADLFDDTALDLELQKIKQKIAQLYNQLAEKAYKVENPVATPEEVAAFLEENGLQFKDEINSFEDESNELQDILDDMISKEDVLEEVKDIKASAPKVESGTKLKAQNDKKDLPKMSSLPDPTGLMATPKDTIKKVSKGVYVEPKGSALPKRKTVARDISYTPLVEQFTEELGNLNERRRIGRKRMLDRLG